MVAPDVVMTTDVPLVVPHEMPKPDTLLAPSVTKGVTEGTKKLSGYERVIEPPVDNCKYGRNDNVTKTFALPETRSDEAITNVR